MIRDLVTTTEGIGERVALRQAPFGMARDKQCKPLENLRASRIGERAVVSGQWLVNGSRLCFLLR